MDKLKNKIQQELNTLNTIIKDENLNINENKKEIIKIKIICYISIILCIMLIYFNIFFILIPIIACLYFFIRKTYIKKNIDLNKCMIKMSLEEINQINKK